MMSSDGSVPGRSFFATIVLVFVAMSGALAAEEAGWKLVKVVAVEGTPGYVDCIVKNTSKEVREVVEHWAFDEVALANMCFFRASATDSPEGISFPPVICPLIAEPCHFPGKGARFLEVKPGATVRARLPFGEGTKWDGLALLLSERSGKVVVGPLPVVHALQPSSAPSSDEDRPHE